VHLKPGDDAIEVIEVGAGGASAPGRRGAGLPPICEAAAEGGVGERVGGERPSFVPFDFCGWIVGILDLE